MKIIDLFTLLDWIPYFSFHFNVSLTRHFHVAGLACIFELLAEPLYILSQNLLLLKLRLVVETVATLFRCITMFILIVKQTGMVRALIKLFWQSWLFLNMFVLSYAPVKQCCVDLICFPFVVFFHVVMHFASLTSRVMVLQNHLIGYWTWNKSCSNFLTHYPC